MRGHHAHDGIRMDRYGEGATLCQAEDLGSCILTGCHRRRPSWLLIARHSAEAFHGYTLMTDGERLEFTYRNARSGSLVFGFGLVIVVETAALHAWLHATHPWASWCLASLSVITVAWLAADYHRFGSGAIVIAGQVLHLHVGLRAHASVPLHAIAEASLLTWRHVPAPGTPSAAEYRNLMKPASPNVLIVLHEPETIRAAGVRLSVRRIGLHLDQPDAFLSAINGVLVAVGMRR